MPPTADDRTATACLDDPRAAARDSSWGAVPDSVVGPRR